MLGSVELCTIDQTATTETSADPMPAHIGVFRTHRGVRIDRDAGEHFGPGDIGINGQPGQQLHLRYVSTRYGAVRLPLHALADAARNRPDDELRPLRFNSLRPAHPEAARRWQKTVQYVADLRSDPDAVRQPLLRGAVTTLLAAALLTTFPNNWVTEPHHQDSTDATPTALARAIAFIDTNADLDITVVDIARAAYVTVRAIQLAFRRHLETTPMAYLRRVRLDRAHEQLNTAGPSDGITVATIAARWGFADPSRFAALYRRTYGQLPSRTLRS